MWFDLKIFPLFLIKILRGQKSRQFDRLSENGIFALKWFLGKGEREVIFSVSDLVEEKDNLFEKENNCHSLFCEVVTPLMKIAALSLSLSLTHTLSLFLSLSLSHTLSLSLLLFLTLSLTL